MLHAAVQRLKFEEIFYLEILVALRKHNYKTSQPGNSMKIMSHMVAAFLKTLPFQLTKSQLKVLSEIKKDMESPSPMNRLLQGDVGSGKTIVALISMLIAVDNGFQAVLMAPTEILADQHAKNISRMMNTFSKTSGERVIKVSLLIGGQKKSERDANLSNIELQEADIIIGTHALFEHGVKFKKLGLVIVDEQHRFGVEQRAKLLNKGIAPDVIVMSATPIPRTLAMTLYGDLDTSIIDEMPPGRKPVITRHVYESKQDEIFNFIRKQIDKGTQVYIVFPLIQESETLDLKNLMEGFESIKRLFPAPGYSIGMVHGKMKQKEKDNAMERFLKKETQILVATTVIEVGVDIPNASVMVIQNAERFGLSQLHQLRGRVGRGTDQAYCILVSSFKLTIDAKKRLETMVETNDGFIIAETDLRLRGPGDLEGTQQSGILNLKIADIIHDEKILKYARNLATDIIRDDPELEKENNAILARHLSIMNKYGQNWGLIS